MPMRTARSTYARIVDTPAIIKLLVYISLFGNLAIGCAFLIAVGWNETSISLLLTALISGGLLLLHRAGFYQAAGLTLYLIVSLVLTFNVSIGHAIYDEAMIAYPLLIIFSGLIFGKRASILVTAISVAELIFIFIMAQAGHVRPFKGALSVDLEETITTAIILIASGFLVWVVIDIIESAVESIQRSELEFENAYELTLAAWAKALELRCREEPGHSARVTSLATALAEAMALDADQIKAIMLGSLLHDIGKMGIPENVLLKEEEFSPQERELVKTHTRLAAGILQDIDYLKAALDVVRSHHERFDGSGYPAGLRGSEIPLAAQIFSIADSWDSLRGSRPCRSAWSDQEALEYIQSQSGKKFDPDVVEAFVAFVGMQDVKEAL